MAIRPKRPALGLFPGASTSRLHDRVVAVLRARHYSPKTEKSYVAWIRRFIDFHRGRHPRTMREPELNAFLTYLAVETKVAPATQDQALAAVLFLYEHVLDEPLDRINGVVRATKPKRLPVALAPEDVESMFRHMQGVTKLIGQLMYGSGLRLSEAVSLRVKDLDFAKGEIIVRGGKGEKDRVTMLPRSLYAPICEHIEAVRTQHQQDLRAGLGRVPMPTALARKFPNADRQWGWQWVFPSRGHFTDKKTGIRQRWHLHESTVQKAVTAARLRSGLSQHVTSHTFRHSFATQLLLNGYDIRTVQELLGHKSIKTTEIYLHVLNRGGLGVMSPLDGAPPRGPYPQPDKTPKDPDGP